MHWPARFLKWVFTASLLVATRASAPAQQVEIDSLHRRILELEARVERQDAARGEIARLRDQVSTLAAQQQGVVRLARLPETSPEPLPEQVGPAMQLDDNPPSTDTAPWLTFPPEENAPLDAPADVAAGGYGHGFELTFWGWLTYVTVPQEDESTFWAWEAEFDVTKAFTDWLAASADIDFVDTNTVARVNIEQLFLSILFPNLGDSVFTAGKFNVPFGIEPRDFWDRQTGSASLLFRAIPRDITGLMYTQPWERPRLIFRPFVVNGFDDNLDINQQPSIGLMVEQRPCEDLSLAVTNWWGPEFANNTSDKLYFALAQVIWQLGPKLSFSAEYLYGTTESPSDDLDWSGFALIVSHFLTEKWRLFAQWSDLDDSDGFFRPDPTRRKEINAGFAYYLHEHVEARAEYRHDIEREYSGSTSETDDLDEISAHLTFGF